jgi:hypothetical protein
MFLFELHTKWLVVKSGSLTSIVNIDYPEILQRRIYLLSRGAQQRDFSAHHRLQRANAFPQNEWRRVR